MTRPPLFLLTTMLLYLTTSILALTIPKTEVELDALRAVGLNDVGRASVTLILHRLTVTLARDRLLPPPLICTFVSLQRGVRTPSSAPFVVPFDGGGGGGVSESALRWCREG